MYIFGFLQYRIFFSSNFFENFIFTKVIKHLRNNKIIHIIKNATIIRNYIINILKLKKNNLKIVHFAQYSV